MSDLIPSGSTWCLRYPGSNSLADLDPAWRPSVTQFIDMLKTAGATVSVAATYRPPQRAWLMHYACLVGGYADKHGREHPPTVRPQDVPSRDDVPIDWGTGPDAVRQARAMVTAYRIVYPAALVSRHTERRAVDMSISWRGTLWVTRKGGGSPIGLTTPADGMHPQLWVVGKSYGVVKLPSDPPHWSTDGH